RDTHLVLLSFPTRRSSDLTNFAIFSFWKVSLSIFLHQPHQLVYTSINTGRGSFLAAASASSIVSQLMVSWAGSRLATKAKAKRKDRKSTRLNSSHVKISYA